MTKLDAIFNKETYENLSNLIDFVNIEIVLNTTVGEHEALDIDEKNYLKEIETLIHLKIIPTKKVTIEQFKAFKSMTKAQIFEFFLELVNFWLRLNVLGDLSSLAGKLNKLPKQYKKQLKEIGLSKLDHLLFVQIMEFMNRFETIDAKINYKLPEILQVSQNHSINTLRHTITGMCSKEQKNKENKSRVSKTMIFRIDNLSDTATSSQGQRTGFQTEIIIHEFGKIKNYLKNEKLNKILDLIFYNLDQQGYKGYIEFPITQFIEYVGNKVTDNCKKDTTKELKPILKILHNFSISSKERDRNFSFVRPFSRAEVKQGMIIIGFDEIFIRSIDKKYFMLPKEVGKLRSAAYYMACYMFIYARHSNKTEFNLMYETLYEYSGLPRYEEVMSKDRAITQKIIEPFLKALYQIKDTLGENVKFTEPEFETGKWNSFKTAKIKIKLPHLKDTVIAISQKRKEAFNKESKKQKSKQG